MKFFNIVPLLIRIFVFQIIIFSNLSDCLTKVYTNFRTDSTLKFAFFIFIFT
nr:MAG TPA: hypothetical protein [Caudoviricetes sp.]